MQDELKKFSREELATFNGENGQPVYIAHDDKVYDVSESKLWKTPIHLTPADNFMPDLSARDCVAIRHPGQVPQSWTRAGIQK